MKRVIVIITICAFLLLPSLLLGDHVPETPGGVVELENHLRLFLKHGNFTPVAELVGRWEGQRFEFRYRALTLGSYYRVARQLKLGAFYRVQQGARHDDDWIDLDPGWVWRDTRGRTEQLLILDVSPRFLLGFLPGRNWVFMLKNRYLFNTFNSQHTLTVRPGVTYFLLRGRDPFLNFSFNYDLYIPLNYGSSFLYAHWPYLNVLYHLSSVVKLDFSAAYKTVTWSSSEDVIASGESDYSVKSRTLLFGLGVILEFEL